MLVTQARDAGSVEVMLESSNLSKRTPLIKEGVVRECNG